MKFFQSRFISYLLLNCLLIQAMGPLAHAAPDSNSEKYPYSPPGYSESYPQEGSTGVEAFPLKEIVVLKEDNPQWKEEIIFYIQQLEHEDPDSALTPVHLDEYFANPNVDWKRAHAVFKYIYLKFVKKKEMRARSNNPDIRALEEMISAYEERKALESGRAAPVRFSMKDFFTQSVHTFWGKYIPVALLATIIPVLGLLLDASFGSANCAADCPFGSYKAAPVNNYQCFDDVTGKPVSSGPPNNSCTILWEAGLGAAGILALPYALIFGYACAKKMNTWYQTSVQKNDNLDRDTRIQSCVQKICDVATELNQDLSTIAIEDFCARSI